MAQFRSPALLIGRNRRGLWVVRDPLGLRGGLFCPHIATGAPITYVACDEDDRLLVVNLERGKVLGNGPLGHNPDVVAEDPLLKHPYVASEGGVLSVSTHRRQRILISWTMLFVGSDAPFVEIDPTTHRLFLPLRNLSDEAVLRIL